MNNRHRAQTAHSCTAPLDFNVRQDALIERRAKAKEVMAEKFPQYKDRVIPKRPPQKDIIKARPKSPDRLPPSLQPASSPVQPHPESVVVEKPVKTRAQKLRELEVRKLKSLARPLDPKLRVDGDRRFFEWATGTADDIRSWQEGEEIGRKLNKVWVPVVSAVDV